MNKNVIAIWVSVGLVIIAVAFLFFYQEHLRINEARIAHTQEVLSKVYDLQNTVREAESGAIDYVTTGNKERLHEHQEAANEVARIYNDLFELLVRTPDQQRRFEFLKNLLDVRLGLLKKAVDLRTLKGAEVAEQVLMSEERRKIQDSILVILEGLEKAEKKGLDPEWPKVRERIRLWVWGLTAGTAICFLLLLITLSLFSREIKVRRMAEERLAANQERLRSVASQLSLAEERERRRISVELHDHVGQGLAFSKIKLGQLRDMAATSALVPLQVGIEEIHQLIEQAIRDTRSLTFRISSPILHELGLEPALEWLCEEFFRQHGIQTSYLDDHQPKPLDENIRILLFQAANELLANVVKHARARNVRISVGRRNDHIHVEVRDDGIGFHPGRPVMAGTANGGFGLFSIRERLEPFGGRLEVSSTPGRGTKVTIIAPLQGTGDKSSWTG